MRRNVFERSRRRFFWLVFALLGVCIAGVGATAGVYYTRY